MTFTKEELLSFNEMMLGRGVPNTEDGIGYNKADFGACSTYYYGLSDAQLYDLAKRLVKYCNTQLGVDKERMIRTAKNLEINAYGQDRSNGVSVDITKDGAMISFKYNQDFINIIKKQPKRKYDSESKNWIVPNSNLIALLNDLKNVGADVKNAIKYAENHELIKNANNQDKESLNELTEILLKYNGEMALLKFNYNKDIVEEIKKIDYKDRQWNADYKFWAIKSNHIQQLQSNLSNVALFKMM